MYTKTYFRQIPSPCFSGLYKTLMRVHATSKGKEKEAERAEYGQGRLRERENIGIGGLSAIERLCSGGTCTGSGMLEGGRTSIRVGDVERACGVAGARSRLLRGRRLRILLQRRQARSERGGSPARRALCRHMRWERTS